MGNKILHLYHYYQPPWQFSEVINQINTECYNWKTKWLNENNEFKATININYSLVEHLLKQGHDKTIRNLYDAAKSGKIEFVGSAAYHALLPFTPEDEIKRQIELNEIGNEKVFGDVWKPQGFFPPEMAINPKIVKIIKEMGYKWTITDGNVFSAHNNAEDFPMNYIPTIHGLPVFFRSDWSNQFSQEWPNVGRRNAEDFVRAMDNDLKTWFDGKNGFIAKAYDAETIGHHPNGYNLQYMQWYAKTIKEVGLEATLFSELLKENLLRKELIQTEEDNNKYKGSWSTGLSDIYAENPYPLWTPLNPINKLQHELLSIAKKTINQNQRAENNTQKARKKLDEAYNSCKLWWANEGYLWNPGLSLLGANETIQVLDILEQENKNNPFFNITKSKIKTNKILEEMKNQIHEKDPNFVFKEETKLKIVV
ncbi:MAG: hypothetical protein KC550_03830 [Nanoarchaeota archaeon]|nr:hypothetical protein [Nanoarchaeota archaeon]